MTVLHCPALRHHFRPRASGSRAQPVVVLTVQAQLGSSPTAAAQRSNITVHRCQPSNQPPVFPEPPMRLQSSGNLLLAQPYTLASVKTAGTAGPAGSSPLAMSRPEPRPLRRGGRRAPAWCTSTGVLPGAGRRALWPWWPGTSAFLLRRPWPLLTVIMRDRARSPVFDVEHLVYQVEVGESLCVNSPSLHPGHRPLGPPGCFPAARVPVWGPAQIPLRLASVASGLDFFAATAWLWIHAKYIILECLPGSQRTSALKRVSTSVIVHVLDENSHSLPSCMIYCFWKSGGPYAPKGMGKNYSNWQTRKEWTAAIFNIHSGKFFKMNLIDAYFVACTLLTKITVDKPKSATIILVQIYKLGFSKYFAC